MLTSDLVGDVDMVEKTMKLLQSILAKDATLYHKTLEHLEVRRRAVGPGMQGVYLLVLSLYS